VPFGSEAPRCRAIRIRRSRAMVMAAPKRILAQKSRGLDALQRHIRATPHRRNISFIMLRMNSRTCRMSGLACKAVGKFLKQPQLQGLAQHGLVQTGAMNPPLPGDGHVRGRCLRVLLRRRDAAVEHPKNWLRALGRPSRLDGPICPAAAKGAWASTERSLRANPSPPPAPFNDY